MSPQSTGFVAAANENRKGKSMPFFNIRSRANSRSLSIAGRANTQLRICVGRMLLLGIGLGIAHPAVAGTNAHGDSSYEAQENSVVVAFLKSRLAEEGKAFCFNATLRGITANDWDVIKTEALKPYVAPEARNFIKDLKAVHRSATQRNTARVVDLTSFALDGMSARVTTYEECSHFENYIINRVLMFNDTSVVSGINQKFGVLYPYAMNIRKNSTGWMPDHYRLYLGFSGPPASSQIKRTLPGAGNFFFIIGESE